MGHAKYVGRVGALAVFLGVGLSVAGVAHAEPADTGTAPASGGDSAKTSDDTPAALSKAIGPGNATTANSSVGARTHHSPVRGTSSPTHATTASRASASKDAVTSRRSAKASAAPHVAAASTANLPAAAAVTAPVVDSAPSGVTGTGPGAPVESPAAWVLLAASRRQLGTRGDSARAATAVATGQPRVVAAAVVNTPPVITAPVVIGTPNAVTGAVTGQVKATDSQTLTYTLTTPPTQGKVLLDKKTGVFTYTPTAAQRLTAQLTPGEQTVTFGVTVSDGTKANNQIAQVALNVSPTQITDIGSVPTGDGALGLAVTNDRAYVTNVAAGTLTVIDTIRGLVVATIDVDALPIGVAVTPDGRKIYVASHGTHSVSVVTTNDFTNYSLSSNKIQLGARSPLGMAISPDGKTLYVTTPTLDPNDSTIVLSSSITKISTTSNKITGTVKNVGLAPYGLTVSPDGKKVYVSSEVESADDTYQTGVFVFSSTSSTAKQITGVGDRPEAVKISPDGKTAYIGDYDTGTISVVETSRYAVVDTIATTPSTIDDLAVNPDGSLLLVLNFATHAVDVYDTTQNYAKLTSVNTDATTNANFPEVALSPDGQQLYYTSDVALQVISLVPGNTAPVGVAPTVGSPNATTGVVTGSVGASDANGDTLTYTPTTPGKGSVVIDPVTGTFTYTPTAAARHAAAAVGAPAGALTDSFTVTVSDGRRGSVTQTVTVNVLPANAIPIGKFTAGSPNGTAGAVKGAVSATDKDKDALTYTLPVATSTRGGTVTIDAKGRFVYTPTAQARHAAAAGGAAATDTFTVTVADGHGASTPITVTVKIAPTNGKPTGATVAVGSPDNAGAITGAVTATDPDGDGVTITGPISTKKGTLSYDSATFTYTPSAAALAAATAPGASTATKTDVFRVTVSDGHGGTATAAVTLTIAAAATNHNPTEGTFSNGTPTASGVVAGVASATDPDGNPLSYSGSQSTSKGVVTVQSNGTYTYTPTVRARHAASAIGASAELTRDAFVVNVSDGRGGTLAINVTVDVVPSNTAPTGSFTAGTPDSNTGRVTGTVTSSDADGDIRSYGAATTSTKGGTVTVNVTTGAFTYTPTAAARQAAAIPGAPSADKVDTFTVTIDDAHGGTTTQVVTVTVAPAVGTPASPTVVGTWAGASTDTNAVVAPNGTIYQPYVTNGSYVIGIVGRSSGTPIAGQSITDIRVDADSYLYVNTKSSSGNTISVVSPTGQVTAFDAGTHDEEFLVSDGIVYLKSPTNDYLFRVSHSGLGVDLTPASSVQTVVVGSTIYYAKYIAQGVQVFKVGSSVPVLTFQAPTVPGVVSPTFSLVGGANGYLYASSEVTEQPSGKRVTTVHVITSGGNQAYVLGADIPPYSFVNGFAEVAPDGTLYLGFTKDSTRYSTHFSPGASSFTTPVAVPVWNTMAPAVYGPSSAYTIGTNAVVTDAVRSVQVTNTFTGATSTPIAFLDAPVIPITVGSDGNAYVLFPAQSGGVFEIWRVSPDGTTTKVYSDRYELDAVPGKIAVPTRTPLAVGPDGTVYLSVNRVAVSGPPAFTTTLTVQLVALPHA